ncbi:MAG: HAD family hydrolase [Candidatus Zixiibacteriota bacterium]
MPKFDKLLVLDIDETLVYATKEKLERDEDFTVGPYAVYKRPGVDEFLTKCLDLFEVGVWTSASEDYATEVIDHLFDGKREPSFLWTSDRCTKSYDYELQHLQYIKDIKKLKRKGYRKESIIIVEDSKEKMQRNYGNAILVGEYLGDRNDSELSELLKYLEELGSVEDVRAVDKLRWRKRTESKL